MIFLHIQQRVYQYKHQYLHNLGDLGVCTLDIIKEVRNFILRRHSLKNVSCLCASHRDTMLSTQRQADYGLRFDKECRTTTLKRQRNEDFTCFFGWHPCPMSSEDICIEIGAKSMDTLVTSTETLEDILTKSELFSSHLDHHNQKMWTSWCKMKLFLMTNCCCLSKCIDSVYIQAITNYNTKIAIIHLAGENMLYINVLKYQTRCDDDIRDLWTKTR